MVSPPRVRMKAHADGGLDPTLTRVIGDQTGDRPIPSLNCLAPGGGPFVAGEIQERRIDKYRFGNRADASFASCK